MSKKWLSKEETMLRTGLTYHGMYPAVKRGELRTRKVPGRAGQKIAVEYLLKDVEAFVAKRFALRECVRDGCSKTLTVSQKKFCGQRCQELNRPSRYTPEYGRMHYQRTKETAIQRSTAWAQAHPERAAEHYRRSLLMRRYGITIAQFKLLEQDSEGTCWICSLHQKERRKDSELRNLAVDHDHEKQPGDITGVRGLLCTTCNVRLKAFEDKAWFVAAMRYKLNSATLVVLEAAGAPQLTGAGLKYGLTDGQRFWLEQRCGGECEICKHVPAGVKQNRLNIDHDHNKVKGEPGYIRGLVCSHCNTKLGVLDDVAFTSAAVAYLEHAPAWAQSILAQALLTS